MNGAKPERLELTGLTLDRRTFIGGAGLAAGGMLAAALVPIALDRGAVSGPVLTVAAGPAWHVDDMWGHSPRYAHPIPYGAAAGEPIAWEHVHPVDRMFVG